MRVWRRRMLPSSPFLAQLIPLFNNLQNGQILIWEDLSLQTPAGAVVAGWGCFIEAGDAC